MQNRYTGDIGDFAKYGLLRALGAGLRLGVAWYLFPDEGHNGDGRHVSYLQEPERWRPLDPALYDALGNTVRAARREVTAIEASGVLWDALFSGALLDFPGERRRREQQRAAWFRNLLADLDGCDLVFADPDNGLCEDASWSPGDRPAWKRIPLSEAQILAAGRTAIIYHHNTRRPGGHAEEIRHWLGRLGGDALALYFRPFSPRTFFILRPTPEIRRRAEQFAQRWSPHFQLHGPGGASTGDRENAPATLEVGERGEKRCPECGHPFRGTGWGGIDAHWKASHADIMSYEQAWPLIRAGLRPSAVAGSGAPGRYEG